LYGKFFQNFTVSAATKSNNPKLCMISLQKKDADANALGWLYKFKNPRLIAQHWAR
jgi:hypothetical protein